MLRLGNRLSGRFLRACGAKVDGFSTVSTSTVDDLKLNIREMVHDSSQAKWTHIDKENETQKVFNICFRTVPQTDNGVAHILGRKNFIRKIKMH